MHDILAQAIDSCAHEPAQREVIEMIPRWVETEDEEIGDALVDAFGDLMDWDFDSDGRIPPDQFREAIERCLNSLGVEPTSVPEDAEDDFPDEEDEKY